MTSGEGKMVCVTGASGYVASWIVKLLLLRGYTVNGTVRNPNDQKKIDHLFALYGAKERLKLFKANLLEEGSFENAIDGCDAVFHTASPVNLNPTDPQAELIEPAVKGTVNVLKTCAKVHSVKKVIVTSSTVAVVVRETPLGPNDLVDESFFSDPSFCEKTKNWYMLSKTLAENAAWEFAEANNINMVVMNPGLVIGPTLQSGFTFSMDVIVDFIKGKNPLNSSFYRLVDVRDVALAHVNALETPSANGRYLIDGPLVTIKDIENALREFFPDVCIADKTGDTELVKVDYKVCGKKLKSLGITEFIPVETGLRDAVLALKEKCLL